MHNVQIKTCKDGSKTLFSKQFQQCYHNPNGALTESNYVFFDSVHLFDRIQTYPRFTLFEIGFGSGLNIWLFIDRYISTNCKIPVHIYSVERFPITPVLALSCSYDSFITHFDIQYHIKNVFTKIQKSGTHTFQINEFITLTIFSMPFSEITQPTTSIDFIIFDPFSPDKNPELWTSAVFKVLADYSSPSVILTTYCSASAAKAAMAVSGWHLAKAPGILGKREITLASLNPDQLSGYKLVNRNRLIERWHNGDFTD